MPNVSELDPAPDGLVGAVVPVVVPSSSPDGADVPYQATPAQIAAIVVPLVPVVSAATQQANNAAASAAAAAASASAAAAAGGSAGVTAATAALTTSLGSAAIDPTTGHLMIPKPDGTTRDAGQATPSFSVQAQGGVVASATITGTKANPILTITVPAGATGATGPASVVGTPKGLWDASANSPTLSVNGGGGVAGDVYIVGTAGTTTLDGVSAWSLGDYVVRSTSTWLRVPAPTVAQAVSKLAFPNSTITDDGDPTYVLRHVDRSGNVAHQVSATFDYSWGTGSFVNLAVQTLTATNFAPQQIAPQSIVLPSSTITDDGNAAALEVKQDPFGFIFEKTNPDGSKVIHNLTVDVLTVRQSISGAIESGGGVSQFFSDQELESRDATNRAYAAQIRNAYDTVSARPIWKYNHFPIYGQSLSSGWEGWPALSRSQPYDNLMLGLNIRPVAEASTTWLPLGGAAAFNPLVAGNESNGANGALLSDSAVAALQPADTTLGETIGEGSLNFLRRQYLQMRGLPSDPSRLFVTSSCGVGGRTIEQLSKGANPEIFNRLRQNIQLAQSVAQGLGGTFGVASLDYLQGEFNYVSTYGGTTDKDAYKALCVQLRSDFITDTKAITGQADPPMIYTYQTGAGFSEDTDFLGIGEAQMELGTTTGSGFTVVGPMWPMTDKGGHLDPNGYRWLGQYFGKAKFRQIVLGQTFRPLYPLQAEWRGTEILVDFHVPVAPLVLDDGYRGNAKTAFASSDGGFTATDDAGQNLVTGVTLLQGTQVLLTMSRARSGVGYVWFADKTIHDGQGALRDSDATVAGDSYAYTAGNGQYTSANIPALVGQPYPLWNWCCAFRIPTINS